MAERQVVSCELRLDAHDIWVATVSCADRSSHKRPVQIGRATRRSSAISRAMEHGELSYASADDEMRIAIAAFRNKPVKLMARGGQLHYLGAV